MVQNLSLGSNGVERVHSLRKIPTPLRGTNFCTSSARFCIEFCKSTKRSQMHQNCMNTPKHEFRVQWGGSVAFITKNSDATSWHELLHQFGPFCTEFRKATKRFRMHPTGTNLLKCHIGVQWSGSGAFVAKNSDATSWHEHFHQFGLFCTEFRKATKRSRIHPNGTKCTKKSVFV